MVNTSVKTRSSVPNQSSAASASLLHFHLNARTENQFLRALSRSRQSTPRAGNSRAEARETAPRSETDTQTTAHRETPNARRSRSNIAPKKHKALLETLPFPGATYAAVSARTAYLAHPGTQQLALLQSARLQAFRAELERCIRLAIRLTTSVECGGEFRWTLSPSLFPDTTIVLRREYDGWQLDATVGDEDWRDVLFSGVVDLRDQFRKKGLGNLILNVAVVSNSDELSRRHGEPTS